MDRTRTNRILRVTMVTLFGVGCGGGEVANSEPAAPLFHSPQATMVTAPDTAIVRFETTEGPFTVRVVRDWAPEGADRFYSLVRAGYYDGVRFYRIVDGFMAQWGAHSDARVTTLWRRYEIPDDPVRESNLEGRVAFAAHGADTRTVEVFVNLSDNIELDEQGFAPFGEVIEGMDVVKALYAEYGDGPPRGEGPYQARVLARGDLYLDIEFPELDSVVRATVVSPAPDPS